MTLTVSREEIKNYLKLNIHAKLARLKEQNRLLERRFEMEFHQFEKKVLNSPKEVFEDWDTYLIWKGNEDIIQKLEQRLMEIDHAEHIVVT